MDAPQVRQKVIADVLAPRWGHRIEGAELSLEQDSGKVRSAEPTEIDGRQADLDFLILWRILTQEDRNAILEYG